MNTLYVVGLGPGKKEYLTAEALHALEGSDVILGYTVYVDLVRPMFPDKEYHTTGMTKEVERCRLALETAKGGKTVSLVCSGDSGVYGMASPVLELAGDYPDVEVVVVSGVTAALSGAAVLGSPLTSDFCVVSLSDLLTPWERIERRLQSAAEGDFALVLYNPSSKKRRDHLQRACDILMAHGKTPETVCGWVRNIGRDGQEYKLLSLQELRNETVDMFTTVFIGASDTTVVDKRMVTPRGYRQTQVECAENSPAVLIFGGTTEGRELSAELLARGLDVTVCVATDYGKEEQAQVAGVRVLAGRKNTSEIEKLLTGYTVCVDATHPYALEASKNIKEAAGKAGTPYLRLARSVAEEGEAGEDTPFVKYFSGAEAVAKYLSETEGNILLATGTKELPAFSGLAPERLYPRVLPSVENIQACERVGIPHRNILALQGPFTEELNTALLNQKDITWFVTKDGGTTGGFPEKVAAAEKAGVTLLVLRPPQEEGLSYEEVRTRILQGDYT